MSYTKYKEVKSIGQGVFGDVYESVYAPTGEHRAVKKVGFTKESLLVPEKISALAAPLLSVKSPNLINLLEVFADVDKTTHKKAAFFVYEFLETGYTDLRTLINKHIKLKTGIDEETIALYLAKSLTAIHALHINGITHQGIKPENIHIPNDTDENQVRISDSGLLQFVNGLGDDRELKGEGVKYWAPEAFTNPKYLPVSDVYSLGAVFYEVLTQKPPYPQTDKSALTHFITNKELSPPAIIPSDTYSKSIIDLITALLNKNPAARPTAAAAYSTISSAYPSLNLPALPSGSFTEGVLVYSDIPLSMDVLRKKLLKAAKSIPASTKTQVAAPSFASTASSGSGPSPFKFGVKSSSGASASSSYTPYTPSLPSGASAEGKSRFGGFNKKPTPGPLLSQKTGSDNAPGKSSVSYLRSIFEKGVASSFSFSPSSYAQGVKRLNHYDATGNLIQQFNKGVSIMDRLRKRKVRATDISALSAADQTEADLAYDLDIGIELDQTTFDDFFAQQQTQVNTETHQPNTPTQAVHGVLANTLPSTVIASDIATIAASAGTAAAQNVAALWRAESRVRDLTEKLTDQQKNGAPAQEISYTKQELKVAEAEVERLRAVVQADEKSQSAQADERRAHRAALARAEKLLNQAREKLATLEKPGSGASQSDLETGRTNVVKAEDEVRRLRGIVAADDEAQSAPNRAALARAEAVARAAHEHLAIVEKPGSGATPQQVGEARIAVNTADAEVARLRKVVAEDEASQNARNEARSRHRADLANAELIAQQAHEHLAELEEPNSGASEADLAKARAAVTSADAEVVRRRAVVQKDDEEYAATAAKESKSTTFTALTVNQLSLMEQGVLKVSDMLEKGETDVAKVFDDGVAELVLKTLLLANNGFAAAVENITRNKKPDGGSNLSPSDLTMAEENFIANAYVINACLFIINSFSLSPDSRHRQILIEGYNAVSIILTSLSLSPLSSPTVVTLPEDVTEEKEADIINASFALSDLFNISVGSLNEDEEDNDRREASGEEVQNEKKENRMKKFFVKDENDNIRKLFGFVVNLKSGLHTSAATSSSTDTGTEAVQETENKLLALRILFTIYKSTPLPSFLTLPTSPVYSGPYAGVLHLLLRFMNEYIAGTWNPKESTETGEKRKELLTSIVQLLLAILYVLDVNHNLHLFVEEGFTKTLSTIAGSSPAQVLHADSDEEERKTYALLISTSITIIDKIYVVPFKSDDAATSSDLAFLRSPETAAFLIESIVPVLIRTVSECLPVSAAVSSATDATTLPFGALFSNEDQNGLRDEAIACIAAFQKNNILTAATLPSTGIVAAYAGWIKAGAEQLSQWTVEGDGDEEDCKSYSLHIHILCTFLNNLLVAKLGAHVAESGTLEAFFTIIHNKYISLQKNNATLLASTYPKIGAILNTFLVNLAVIGANSAPQGKENIFLPYFLKNNAPQYLGPFIESSGFKTAFTPAQQFGFVRATFFFFKDYVVDPAVIQAPLSFLRTYFSNAQNPVEEVKIALRCLVLIANKKENLPTLKSANLSGPLENYIKNANPEVAKLSTQLRGILK